VVCHQLATGLLERSQVGIAGADDGCVLLNADAELFGVSLEGQARKVPGWVLLDEETGPPDAEWEWRNCTAIGAGNIVSISILVPLF
jgi:hypothetical protein